MAKKIYAIKEGFDFENNIKVENKLLDSWDECLKYVKGVKGAKYKSFTSKKEADEYLSSEGLIKKSMNTYPQDVPHFYVDGSYNNDTEKYSYGVVVVKNGVVIHIENGAAKDNKSKSIRQIAGELEGSIKSLEYAEKNGFKDIVIIHDYVGVCYHATGAWERKEESSKKYYERFNSLTKENGINVTFVKVDSHTGDLFNEVVDEFAKEAAAISIKGETAKCLKSQEIKVENDEIKGCFRKILKDEYLEKVIVESIKV
jgi:ribonuclease HI